MSSKLSETLALEPVRVLAYGVSGSAKTTTGAMAVMHEGFYPMYVFDWDLRIGSLRAKLDRQYWDRIQSDPYRDVRTQGEAFAIMQAKIDRLEAEGYKSIMIDSGTFCLLGIMARVLLLDGGKPATSTPQLQNYMQQQSLFKDVVSRLCSKSLHVIMNCHEDNQKDEVSGRLFKAVDLTGKLANQVPGYFNEIWHMEVVTTTSGTIYSVRTRSDFTYAARTSYKTLDSLEAQDKIWGKIVKERSEVQMPAAVGTAAGAAGATVAAVGTTMEEKK